MTSSLKTLRALDVLADRAAGAGHAVEMEAARIRLISARMPPA